MVYPSKRKRSFRRKFGKKFYKKYNKSSFTRKPLNSGNVHFFKRTQIVNLILDRNVAIADPVTGHNIWCYANAAVIPAFSLNQTDGYTDFTTLFDQYKLNGINWELMSYNNGSDIGSGTNGWIDDLQNFVGSINVHTCLDYDEDSVISSIATMGQYRTYKRFTLNGTHKAKRFVKAKSLVQTYETAVTTGYAPKSQWIDCNDDSVPHYGIKFIIEEPRTHGGVADLRYLPLQLKLTHYYAFKDPR